MTDEIDAKQYVIQVQDAYAPRFDALYHDITLDPYRSTFTYGRMRVDELIEPTLDAVEPGSRFLDVGCGTGFHVARLRERGFEVIGIEPGEDLRRRARANNPGVQIDDGDIEHLPFADASFDGVLVIEILRHLARPGAAIAEVARVVRPGGVAILTAAPRWSLSGYALINQVTSRVPIPTFTKQKQSFMSEAHGRRLLRESGFSSVEVHGALLGPWQVVERLSPSLLSRSLRVFDPLDRRLADRRLLRDLANHLLFVARR